MDFFKYKDETSVIGIPRNCDKGKYCTYAHGSDDLKQLKRPCEDRKITMNTILNDTVVKYNIRQV